MGPGQPRCEAVDPRSPESVGVGLGLDASCLLGPAARRPSHATQDPARLRPPPRQQGRGRRDLDHPLGDGDRRRGHALHPTPTVRAGSDAPAGTGHLDRKATARSPHRTARMLARPCCPTALGAQPLLGPHAQDPERGTCRRSASSRICSVGHVTRLGSCPLPGRRESPAHRPASVPARDLDALGERLLDDGSPPRRAAGASRPPTGMTLPILETESLPARDRCQRREARVLDPVGEGFLGGDPAKQAWRGPLGDLGPPVSGIPRL